MPSFRCDFLNEIVILSNGNTTTCCMDPLDINHFGNIYKDDFKDIQRRYIKIRRKITEDVLSMPRCRICYNKIKDAGFPETGTYKVYLTTDEIKAFFDMEENIVNNFVIELTSKCNLICNGCMQSRFDFKEIRQDSFLDVDFLKTWIGQNSATMKKIRLYNYGETFLHPEAIDFCSYIKERNPSIQLTIATNGMPLNTHEKREKLIKSGVDAISFSIHGSSQETIEKYMTKRFDFNLIIEILKDMVSIKRQLGLDKPKLVWKYLLFEWNDSDEEIKRAKTITKEIGINSITFDLVGFPSPSKRYTRNSENWNNLIQKNHV